MRRYCQKCKKVSEAEQELKFCSHCGAPFEPICEHPAEQVVELTPVTPMAQAQAQASGEERQEESYCAWEDKARLGFFGALYETWKESLFNPSRFFRRMPAVGGIGNPLIYAIILGMIGVIFSLMYDHLWGQLFNMSDWYEEFGYGMNRDFYEFYALSNQVQSISMLLWLIMAPVVLTISLFITSGVTHLILLIFGWSKTGFEGTFRAISYSYGAMFFEIVPFFGGMISAVWLIVLYIIGIKEIHRLSAGKAVLAVFLPMILFCLCCCGFFSIIMGVAGFSNFR